MQGGEVRSTGYDTSKRWWRKCYGGGVRSDLHRWYFSVCGHGGRTWLPSSGDLSVSISGSVLRRASWHKWSWVRRPHGTRLRLISLKRSVTLSLPHCSVDNRKDTTHVSAAEPWSKTGVETCLKALAMRIKALAFLDISKLTANPLALNPLKLFCSF